MGTVVNILYKLFLINQAVNMAKNYFLNAFSLPSTVVLNTSD